VERALGEPIAPDPMPGPASCAFNSTEMLNPKTLSLSAAQGQEAKALLMLSAQLMLIFVQDPEVAQAYASLEENNQSLSLAELLEEFLAIFQAVGMQFEPVAEMGEGGYWAWSEMGTGSLYLVQDNTYAAINVVGFQEEARARSAAMFLMPLLWERLPTRFSVPVEGTFTFSTDDTPPQPTEPTPIVVTPLPDLWVIQYRGSTLTRLSATDLALVSQIPLGGKAVRLARGQGAIWVADEAQGSLLRVDPLTNQVAQRVQVAQPGPLDVAAGPDIVWAAACAVPELIQVDPLSDQVVASIPLEEPCWTARLAEGYLWVSVGDDGVQVRDPMSGQLKGTIAVGSGPAALASGEGAMWVLNVNSHTVSRIDPRARRVTDTIPIPLQGNLTDISVGEGAVWVVGTHGLIRIDPDSNQIRGTLELPQSVRWVAAGGGWVWVSSYSQGSLIKVDPASLEIAQTLALGGNPGPMALGP
jgi:streptogramin lyase